MTKSKYTGKTVVILDEDGEEMPMDYVEAVDTYYTPLCRLAKKVKVSSRTLQRQIEAKKYDTAFDEVFNERLNHDSKIGDLINYPSQGRPKYVSPRLSLIIENYQTKGIAKYLDEKQKELFSKGSDSSSVSFFIKSAGHDKEINDDLTRLKNKIREQEKSYVNNYRKRLTLEIIDDYVKTRNVTDQDEFIKKIRKLADRNQRVKFSKEVREELDNLEKDIMKQSIDYEYLMRMTKNWKTDLYPFYGLCAMVKRERIESKKKERVDKEKLSHQKQYVKILHWK